MLANGDYTQTKHPCILIARVYYLYVNIWSAHVTCKQLRKMIHFTDSLNQNPDDELKKLRFFEETYKPEEHLAIDKYRSLSKPSTTIRRLHKSF